MKRLAILFVSAVFLLSLTACGANVRSRTEEEIRLSFGAASPGGKFYVMESGIAAFVTEKSDRLSLTAQTTGGSAENIRLISNGEMDIGLANGSELYWARNGKAYFEDDKAKNINIVSFAWTNTFHAVVLKDSDIHTVYDFEGKKVGVGPQGSAAAIFTETLFKALGLWDKLTPVYTPPGDQATALKDGNIDVFGYFSGIPMASVIDISATQDIRIIDMQEAGEASGFNDDNPFFSLVTIPGGTYKGQDEDVQTYANYTYIIADEKIPEDIVYEFMRTLFSEEGLSYMLAVHSSAEEMTIANIDFAVEKIDVPLHPGTLKYLKENNE